MLRQCKFPRPTGLAASLVAALMATAVPAAAQQPGAPVDVRYCGIGFQGADKEFAAANPNLYRVFSDIKTRGEVYNALRARIRSSNPNLNLTESTDQGATLVLAHLLTYERAEAQSYTDPRDNRKSWVVIYSLGVNTILFDPANRKIRKISPAVITYSERSPIQPVLNKPLPAFAKIFADIHTPETAAALWADSISNLDYVNTEAYFSVRPVKLSADAQGELEAGMAGQPGQSVGAFIKRVTSQQEALLAGVFRKPVVPVNIDSNGLQAARLSADPEKYAAVLPSCFDDGQALELPEPNYVMQVTIDKLARTEFQHRLGADAGAQAGQVYQIEQGFGGRYNVQFLLPGDGGDQVLDDQTFAFSRSVRFSKPVDVNPVDQYAKLTVNFVDEALAAYATQKKKWVKANLSAAITDKKKRDAGKIAKGWAATFAQRMAILPPPRDDDANGDKD